MSQFYEAPDLAAEIRKLQQRIDGLERAQGYIPAYTFADQPPPAAVPHRLIFVINPPIFTGLLWSDGVIYRVVA